MKILLVGKVPTHPIKAGNSRLIVDTAELLKELGHEVHYLYISERPIRDILKKNEDVNIKAMQNYWQGNLHVSNISLFPKIRLLVKSIISKLVNGGYLRADSKYSNSTHKIINKLNCEYKFDACLINYYHLSKALVHIDIPIKALIAHDIFSFRKLTVKPDTTGSLKPNDEAKALQRCPNILAIQEEDAVFFKKLSPFSNIYTTFTRFKFEETPAILNHNILFLSGNSRLNLNGLYWFINDILPKILKIWPDAKIIIGGGICKSLDNLRDKEGIEIKGYVDNPYDFFKMGDVAINPTMSGTGLKIKTMESLSYGKIVMTHPHSIIGLYKQESLPIFASKNPDEWISFLGKIWSDKVEVLNLKKEASVYMSKLNSHIINEYKRLLE